MFLGLDEADKLSSILHRFIIGRQILYTQNGWHDAMVIKGD
jgi:hypothetical protein